METKSESIKVLTDILIDELEKIDSSDYEKIIKLFESYKRSVGLVKEHVHTDSYS